MHAFADEFLVSLQDASVEARFPKHGHFTAYKTRQKRQQPRARRGNNVASRPGAPVVEHSQEESVHTSMVTCGLSKTGEITTRRFVAPILGQRFLQAAPVDIDVDARDTDVASLSMLVGTAAPPMAGVNVQVRGFDERRWGRCIAG